MRYPWLRNVLPRWLTGTTTTATTRTNAFCFTVATGPRISPRIRASPTLPPLTYARFTTDDTAGVIRGYVGQGQTTDDQLNTFGQRAVAHIPGLQNLLRHVCLNGYEHHVAVNASHTADIVAEACGTYLGWSMFHFGKGNEPV
jgi:L-fucose isomerase-like protein